MSQAQNGITPISDGWGLWNTIWLRSAGFPARRVLRLASEASSRAIEKLLADEEALGPLREQAIAASRAATEVLPREQARVLGKLIKKLEKSEAIEAPSGLDAALDDALRTPAFEGSSTEARQKSVEAAPRFEGSLTETLRSYVAAHARVEEARRAAADHFSADTVRVGEVLREAARDPLFIEALLWQNRGALRGTIDALLRHPAGATDSKTREHERLVANYLQRYCVKNDTIGFFGPVGWAELDPKEPEIFLESGEALLRRRTVYFEYWAIAALANVLAQDLEIKVELPPRRHPLVRVENNTLYYGADYSTPVTDDVAAVLERCDAKKSARAIAAELAGTFDDPDEVFELLDQLEEKKLIVWSLEIPVWEPRPELALRRRLESLPEGDSRTNALAKLARLEAAKAAVAKAAGNTIELEKAIVATGETFTELTGADSVRRGGQSYAGRTLIYEDCVRDVECRFSTKLADRLGPPLALLLRSARWYTSEVTRRYREIFHRPYFELKNELGTSVVDYPRYWSRIVSHFAGHKEISSLSAEVAQELRNSWNRILQVTADQTRVQVPSAAIRARVEKEFPAARPGSPLARFHSPDVMIAADGVEAIRRGDYLIVLGELHISINSMFIQAGLVQHDNPEFLHELAETALPARGACFVDSTEAANRAITCPPSRKHVHVEMHTGLSPAPRSRVRAAGELVVEQIGDELVVRTRDQELSFDVITFHQDYLAGQCTTHFSLSPGLKHGPRVTIDDVVVTREHWRFAPAELPFADLPTPFDRFLAAQRWRRAHQLPRFVFIKVPEEPKPCYVDFESSIFVETFIKQVRKASTVAISEMLPTLDQLWLTDRAGERYTSELRMAAVDPESWVP